MFLSRTHSKDAVETTSVVSRVLGKCCAFWDVFNILGTSSWLVRPLVWSQSSPKYGKSVPPDGKSVPTLSLRMFQSFFHIDSFVHATIQLTTCRAFILLALHPLNGFVPLSLPRLMFCVSQLYFLGHLSAVFGKYFWTDLGVIYPQMYLL